MQQQNQRDLLAQLASMVEALQLGATEAAAAPSPSPPHRVSHLLPHLAQLPASDAAQRHEGLTAARSMGPNTLLTTAHQPSSHSSTAVEANSPTPTSARVTAPAADRPAASHAPSASYLGTPSPYTTPPPMQQQASPFSSSSLGPHSLRGLTPAATQLALAAMAGTREEQVRRLIGSADDQLVQLAIAAAAGEAAAAAAEGEGAFVGGTAGRGVLVPDRSQQQQPRAISTLPSAHPQPGGGGDDRLNMGSDERGEGGSRDGVADATPRSTSRQLQQRQQQQQQQQQHQRELREKTSAPSPTSAATPAAAAAPPVEQPFYTAGGVRTVDTLSSSAAAAQFDPLASFPRRISSSYTTAASTTASPSATGFPGGSTLLPPSQQRQHAFSTFPNVQVGATSLRLPGSAPLLAPSPSYFQSSLLGGLGGSGGLYAPFDLSMLRKQQQLVGSPLHMLSSMPLRLPGQA